MLPYDRHRTLQLSGPGMVHAGFTVVVDPAVYEQEPGQDDEVIPMSDSFRQLHDLSTIPTLGRERTMENWKTT
ncbi:MAG TPA: hypothetical protein PLD25_31030 [Chloroflexota bacterium]|nr:hypothetical protein [Chloroflexota bacterium]HUM70461.1 hypothetical protein [Chloroflexota bacterium]